MMSTNNNKLFASDMIFSIFTSKKEKKEMGKVMLVLFAIIGIIGCKKKNSEKTFKSVLMNQEWYFDSVFSSYTTYDSSTSACMKNCFLSFAYNNTGRKHYEKATCSMVNIIDTFSYRPFDDFAFKELGITYNHMWINIIDKSQSPTGYLYFIVLTDSTLYIRSQVVGDHFAYKLRKKK